MLNLKEYFQSLTTKTIKSSTVGGGVGSIIKIEFETNDYIFIYCTWRFECNDIVLSSSEDDPAPIIGLMSSTIVKMQNKKIEKISVSNQYDLTIYMEDNYVLRVFCSISYSNIGYSNWELCSPNQNIVFSVNNEYKVDLTTYF